MGAKHWTEADYYSAVGRARAAWEASQPQLVLGLEGADAGTTSLVASAPSSPNDGLAAGEGSGSSQRTDSVTDVHRSHMGGHSRTPEQNASPAASPPSPHADGTHSDTPPRVGEGGLDNPTTREN